MHLRISTFMKSRRLYFIRFFDYSCDMAICHSFFFSFPFSCFLCHWYILFHMEQKNNSETGEGTWLWVLYPTEMLAIHCYLKWPLIFLWRQKFKYPVESVFSIPRLPSPPLSIVVHLSWCLAPLDCFVLGIWERWACACTCIILGGKVIMQVFCFTTVHFFPSY